MGCRADMPGNATVDMFLTCYQMFFLCVVLDIFHDFFLKILRYAQIKSNLFRNQVRWFGQRAGMGSREGRYGYTRGPIWVLESGMIWIRNHEPYRPG